MRYPNLIVESKVKNHQAVLAHVSHLDAIGAEMAEIERVGFDLLRAESAVMTFSHLGRPRDDSGLRALTVAAYTRLKPKGVSCWKVLKLALAAILT
jgi:hypothetical protein